MAKDSAQTAQLDKYGFPVNSSLSVGTLPPKQIPWELGVQQSLQGKRIRMSQIQLKNFGTTTNVAFGTGSFANGGTLFLTTKLTPLPPHQSDINIAFPFTAVYQGTVQVGANQIYPTLGTNIAAASYTVVGGLDFQLFTGTNSAWSGYIVNNSGAQATVAFYTQWKWIQYNNGTVT